MQWKFQKMNINLLQLERFISACRMESDIECSASQTVNNCRKEFATSKFLKTSILQLGVDPAMEFGVGQWESGANPPGKFFLATTLKLIKVSSLKKTFQQIECKISWVFAVAIKFLKNDEMASL